MPYGVLVIRSTKGQRLGFATIRAATFGHPGFDELINLTRDECALPRLKAELCDVKATPWTVLFIINIDTRLDAGKTYILVEPAPNRRQFAIKVVLHRI